MQTIESDALKMIMSAEKDLLLINTLDAESFDKTRIPHSVNIPQAQSDFVNKVEQAAEDKSKPVVVYCASSDCDSSTKAAQKLEEAGFSQVIDYAPGARGWQESGESLQP